MVTPARPHEPCGGRRDFLRATGAAAALLLLGPGDALASVLYRGDVAPTGRTGRGDLRYPVPAADGALVDRENAVILVRWEGWAYAFALSCPHQNTALRWVEKEGRFQCPKHKSKYGADGTYQSGRATRSMDRYPVTLEGGEIVVRMDPLLRQDEAPEAWAAARVRL